MKIKKLFFSALFLAFLCTILSFNVVFAVNPPTTGEASPSVASDSKTPPQNNNSPQVKSTTPPTPASPPAKHNVESKPAETPKAAPPVVKEAPVQVQAPSSEPSTREEAPEIKKVPEKEVASEEKKPTEEIKKEDAITSDEKAPADLPDVESDEILFPEVISASDSSSQKPKNLLAGIIAWTCIALGIAIVIFVLIKGRHRGEIEPKNMKVHNAPHKKKGRRLLDDKYYKK